MGRRGWGSLCTPSKDFQTFGRKKKTQKIANSTITPPNFFTSSNNPLKRI
jgi:hypothetical protein